MSRLIDADALTKSFVEFCNKNCPYTAKARNVMCGSCFMGLALESVDDAPTIEPERKTGKWIISSKFDDCYYAKCDVCNIKQVFYGNKPVTNFCQNCGAKMEAET